MSKQFPWLTPVRVIGGRHEGKIGIVRFYGVSKYDVKQPVAAIHTPRGWLWVLPHQIEEITREELREYDRRAYSEILAERSASGDRDPSDETHH